MATQYLAGSIGYHIPTGREFVLAQDTCSDAEKAPVNFIDSASDFYTDAGLPAPPAWKPMRELCFTEPKTQDFQGA